MTEIVKSEMRPPQTQMKDGCSSGLPSILLHNEKKKKSHFYQIINPLIIENRRLELPRKFIRKFGKELSEVAVIMVPNGKLWRLKLRKAEGEISFQSGWQEFMDYYSIRLGHLLVFRYDGNSHFHVLIFDMSVSEINYKYPSHTEDLGDEKTKSCAQSENPSSNPKDEPEMVLILSDSESDDEPTMSTPLKSASSRSRHVSFSTEKINNLPEPSVIGFSAPQVNQRNERIQQEASALRKKKQEASAEALRTAREFKSENQFFTITMRPSYVSEQFLLNVPVGLAQYLIHKTQSLTLRVSDGRMWHVGCNCGKRRFKPYAKLYKGWKEFVLDNHLENGDVCVFELIDMNNFEIKVSIFRAS